MKPQIEIQKEISEIEPSPVNSDHKSIPKTISQVVYTETNENQTSILIMNNYNLHILKSINS